MKMIEKKDNKMLSMTEANWEGTNKIAVAEIQWYLQYGKYPERIMRAKKGCYYISGDFLWNRLHPERLECIERRMEQEGVYVDA